MYDDVYDEIFDQNWASRPFGEGGDHLFGEKTGEESDKEHAREAFNALMEIDRQYDHTRSLTVVGNEHKQKLSLINDLTEGDDNLLSTPTGTC